MKVLNTLLLTISILSCTNNQTPSKINNGNIIPYKNQIIFDDTLINKCNDSIETFYESRRTTILIFDMQNDDSINIYINNVLVQSNILNILTKTTTILNYGKKFKITRLNSGIINMDTLRPKKMRIEFFKRNKYIEFIIKKYSPFIVIQEDSTRWHIIYDFCVENLDE